MDADPDKDRAQCLDLDGQGPFKVAPRLPRLGVAERASRQAQGLQDLGHPELIGVAPLAPYWKRQDIRHGSTLCQNPSGGNPPPE